MKLVEPIESLNLHSRIAHLERLVAVLVGHTIADTWSKVQSGQRLTAHTEQVRTCIDMVSTAMHKGMPVDTEASNTTAFWVAAMAEVDDDPTIAARLDGLPRRMTKAVAHSVAAL